MPGVTGGLCTGLSAAHSAYPGISTGASVGVPDSRASVGRGDDGRAGAGIVRYVHDLSALYRQVDHFVDRLLLAALLGAVRALWPCPHLVLSPPTPHQPRPPPTL